MYGSRYLRESLPSLLAQDYENLEILLLDQEEGVYSATDFIQTELPSLQQDSRVELTRGTNQMHSGGHNTLIARAIRAEAEYYVCASNDMLYAPDCVSQLIRELEQPANARVGSVAAQLLRWDYCEEQADLPITPFAKGGRPAHAGRGDCLDSTGIAITPTGRFVDRGQGERATGQYDAAIAVWGASGALAGYRVSALVEVALGAGQYFDSALHYKDDVELAARLAAAGWLCRYAPTARAWHARGLSASTRSASSPRALADSLAGQLALTRRHWQTLPLAVRLRYYALLAWSKLT